MHLRIRRSALLMALLVALILLPFILPYIDVFRPEGESESLEDLMLKAVYHGNESAVKLQAIPEEQPVGLGELASQATGVGDALQKQVDVLPPSKLGETLAKAAETYAVLAKGASHTYLAADSLAHSLDGVEEALNLLQECRIDEALEKYREARPGLQAASKELAEALKILEEGDPENLLSGNHTQVYLRLRDAVNETLSMLEELDRLFSLVESNAGALKSLCTGAGLSAQQLRGVISMLENLNPGNAGKYAYEEAQFLSMVQGMLGSAQGQEGQAQQGGGSGQTPQGGSQTGTSPQGQGSGGSGAGYGTPPSDD